MDNLLKYPSSALVNRIIPKKAFYGHLEVNQKMKQHFVNDINSFTWLYKLAENTVNVPAGKRIAEINVFAALLKEKDCPDDVFRFIDSCMPQYLVFILCYEGECRLLIDYKEPTESPAAPFRIIKTFTSDWLPAAQLQLTMQGKNLDAVYESFAGIISGYHTTSAEATKEIIALKNELALKRKTVEALQKKIRKERQFNRQVEMNTKARQMKREIKQLTEKIEQLMNGNEPENKVVL